MGAINPSKMPKAKVKKRRDDTDFKQFRKGGKIKKFAEEGLVQADDGPIAKDESKFIPEDEYQRSRYVNMQAPEQAKEDLPDMSLKYDPKYLALAKNYQGLGGRFSLNKPLSPTSNIQAYLDTNISNAKGSGLTGRGTGFGVNFSKQFDKGGEIGLYANIHKKKERIKREKAEGKPVERMRKPGTKGAPTKQAFIKSAKTAKK
jgi:hypothetical protein